LSEAFFSEADLLNGVPAKIDLSNGAEDVVFLLNGTAVIANATASPVLASCHLREDTAAGSRAIGSTWVTVPAGSSLEPGFASAAMAGWTVVMSGSVSTVTVECNRSLAAATAAGTRVGLFIMQ